MIKLDNKKIKIHTIYKLIRKKYAFLVELTYSSAKDRDIDYDKFNKISGLNVRRSYKGYYFKNLKVYIETLEDFNKNYDSFKDRIQAIYCPETVESYEHILSNGHGHRIRKRLFYKKYQYKLNLKDLDRFVAKQIAKDFPDAKLSLSFREIMKGKTWISSAPIYISDELRKAEFSIVYDKYIGLIETAIVKKDKNLQISYSDLLSISKSENIEEIRNIANKYLVLYKE